LAGQRDVLEGIMTFAKEKARGEAAADRSAGTGKNILE